MGKALIPELHDIGKLYRLPEAMRRQLAEVRRCQLDEVPGYLHGVEADVLELLGVPLPDSDTWIGITEHHGKKPLRKDLFLARIADHAASSASRGIEHRGSGTSLSVHRLWQPHQHISLQKMLPECSLDTTSSLAHWLGTEPSAEMFFERYESLLQVRPEELAPPFDTVSLATHCTLVGKLYRFLESRVVSRSQNNEESWAFDEQVSTDDPRVADQEWQVFVLIGKIRSPQYVTRTRDMAVFDLMLEHMQRLASDDKVLICTFDQFMALCSSPEDIIDLVAPAASAGLIVTWEAARTPITELKSSPSEMRAQFKNAKTSSIEDWWRPISAAWSKMSRETRRQRQESLCQRKKGLEKTLAADYPRGVAAEALPQRIVPPICDVCQLEPATKRWPDNPTDAGPFEDIGERCYALRQRAVHLVRLSAWTDEPSCRVIWVYIGLDLGRLVGFLRPLLIQYAKQHLNAQQLAEIDVRPPLLLEFQKDYVRFLQNWADALKDYAGEDNIEHVSGSSGLAGNSLLCLRLGDDLAIPELLKLYHQGIQRYFPVCLTPDLPTESAKSIPFRLYLGVSGVKFPFSEHWRMAQETDADLLIHIVGRGSMRAPLPSLPALIQMAHPANQTALHNLTEVAGISEALADLHIENRADGRHYRSYAVAMQAMRPFGMSHKDLIMFARILEG